MPGIDAAEGFWDFSVCTYCADGVADACVSLQNDHGADVNMLLFCCWVGVHFGRFDRELFGKASRFSTHWTDNVVMPLRSARTWMKHHGCETEPVPMESCMALREEIKAIELSSEKMQQEVLESLVLVELPRNDAPDQILADVVANLVLYAGFAGFEISDAVQQKFAVIILGAYPAWDEQAVMFALASGIADPPAPFSES